MCACWFPTARLRAAGCFLQSSGGWQDVQRETITDNSVQLRVPVLVRHERDPYLYFLDISDGTLDFGLTTKEVRGATDVLRFSDMHVLVVVT